MFISQRKRPCSLHTNSAILPVEVELMGELGTALMISGGILLVVVVFLVFISMAAVNRGEAAMREDTKQSGKSH